MTTSLFCFIIALMYTKHRYVTAVSLSRLTLFLSSSALDQIPSLKRRPNCFNCDTNEDATIHQQALSKGNCRHQRWCNYFEVEKDVNHIFAFVSNSDNLKKFFCAVLCSVFGPACYVSHFFFKSVWH